jgi:signal transduction histidine kinase
MARLWRKGTRSKGGGTWLAFILVVISLISAIVLPRIADDRVTALRNEINDIADPARLRVTDILLDLALQASQRRGYLLSDDNALSRDYALSRSRRLQSQRELATLAQRLDAPTSTRLANEVGRLGFLTRRLDSLVSLRGAESSDALEEQHRVFLTVRQMADSIGGTIDSIAADKRARIARTENITRLLTAGLVLLGLVAAFVVARLSSRYRELLDRERAAREIADERRLEIERITESRGRLLRGFTHDVKNPLSAADGYLSLLEDGVLGSVEERQRKPIVRARASIRQALELIARLLDLARAESGQLELNWSTIDVTEQVRDIADAFMPQAQSRGIRLDVALPPELPPIQTDAARLRQVIGNLISNAVKYTPAGGHVQVDAAVQSNGVPASRQVLISVCDDGPGIPEDRMPRLFQEFTRFDPAAAEGAGVGLAISQKIAEALGGSISVESSVGVGSKFVLHVPVERGR